MLVIAVVLTVCPYASADVSMLKAEVSLLRTTLKKRDIQIQQLEARLLSAEIEIIRLRTIAKNAGVKPDVIELKEKNKTTSFPVLRDVVEFRRKMIAEANRIAIKDLKTIARQATKNGNLPAALNAYRRIQDINPADKDAARSLQSTQTTKAVNMLTQPKISTTLMKPAKNTPSFSIFGITPGSV